MRRDGAWAALCACLLAVTMQMIDVTVVTVALPTIAGGFDASPSQQISIPTSYLLAFACSLLTMARFGDVLGRRAVFIGGTAAFVVASAACGLAPNAEVLIASRVAQGIAGAAMSAQTVAIVAATFDPSRRTKAFALYGATAGLAGLAGPSVGAMFLGLDAFGSGWRMIFLINVPVGLLTIAIARRFIRARETEVVSATKGFDPIGAVLSSAGLLLTIFPLLSDLTPGLAVTCAATGVAILTMFVVHERRVGARGGHVLLHTELFTHRSFAYGCGVSILVYGTFTGFVLTTSVTLQSGLGESATTVGLITLPFAIGAIVTSAASPVLYSRWDSRVVAVGTATLALSLVAAGVLTAYLDRPTGLAWMCVPLLTAGAGLGAVIAPLQSTIVAGVAPGALGSASGILPTVQQVGSAIGTAAAGAAFFAGLEHLSGASDYLDSQRQVLFAMAATMALATVAATCLPRTPRLVVSRDNTPMATF